MILQDFTQIIDEFDDLGILDGHIDPQLCPISAVRITLKNSSDFWVILSEVCYQFLKKI